MVTSPIESFFMRSLLAASKSDWQLVGYLIALQREAYMPEDNPARKSFEAGARTAREAVDRGTAAAEQATQTGRAKLRVHSGRHRKFNAKLLDIAQAYTMAA